jgi:ABC-type multidrug transport system fused ATPase/permease subunit
VYLISAVGPEGVRWETGRRYSEFERLAAALRKDAFRAMLSQETAWFDTSRTGELVNRLSADTALVQKALTNNVASGLRAVAMTLGGTAMLFALSPSLAMLSLSLIPPVALAGVYYGRYVSGQQRAVQEALGDATAAAEESLSQIRTVRQFAGERAEAARFGLRVDAAAAQAASAALKTAKKPPPRPVTAVGAANLTPKQKQAVCKSNAAAQKAAKVAAEVVAILDGDKPKKPRVRKA